MEKIRLAYCNECEDLVEYDSFDEEVVEEYKGETVKYRFIVGRCKNCNCEVAMDNDYNYKKSYHRIEAYKKAIGIITLDEITEILEKYNVGKEALSDIAGFGKVTIKRYFEGYIPSREYSDKLLRILSDEKFFHSLVEENKSKLKGVTYKKVSDRYERLCEISKSKIDQIINYIVVNMEEVTPLALEKLLSFCEGVNYALNGNQLISEQAEAWPLGPVYPDVYKEYKHYGHNPINEGIKSSHGWMLCKLNEDEIKAINMVINTFGLYSTSCLVKISHLQDPWIEKRVGYDDDERCNEVIDEESIKNYYIEHELNSEESIMKYIMECIKG